MLVGALARRLARSSSGVPRPTRSPLARDPLVRLPGRGLSRADSRPRPVAAARRASGAHRRGRRQRQSGALARVRAERRSRWSTAGRRAEAARWPGTTAGRALPADLAPGARASRSRSTVRAPTGRPSTASTFDLVDEGVATFASKGSPVGTLDVDVLARPRRRRITIRTGVPPATRIEGAGSRLHRSLRRPFRFHVRFLPTTAPGDPRAGRDVQRAPAPRPCGDAGRELSRAERLPHPRRVLQVAAREAQPDQGHPRGSRVRRGRPDAAGGGVPGRDGGGGDGACGHDGGLHGRPGGVLGAGDARRRSSVRARGGWS